MTQSHRLDADLLRWSEGELTRAELVSRHPGVDVERQLDLHGRLAALTSGPVSVPDWSRIAPSLAAEPGNSGRRKRKVFALILAGGIIVGPAVAEAISPGTVRRSIIEPITEVLPFVTLDDEPETDQTETDQTETDQTETDQTETDQTESDQRPAGDDAELERDRPEGHEPDTGQIDIESDRPAPSDGREPDRSPEPEGDRPTDEPTSPRDRPRDGEPERPADAPDADTAPEPGPTATPTPGVPPVDPPPPPTPVPEPETDRPADDQPSDAPPRD